MGPELLFQYSVYVIWKINYKIDFLQERLVPCCRLVRVIFLTVIVLTDRHHGFESACAWHRPSPVREFVAFNDNVFDAFRFTSKSNRWPEKDGEMLLSGFLHVQDAILTNLVYSRFPILVLKLERLQHLVKKLFCALPILIAKTLNNNVHYRFYFSKFRLLSYLYYVFRKYIK